MSLILAALVSLETKQLPRGEVLYQTPPHCTLDLRRFITIQYLLGKITNISLLKFKQTPLNCRHNAGIR